MYKSKLRLPFKRKHWETNVSTSSVSSHQDSVSAVQRRGFLQIKHKEHLSNFLRRREHASQIYRRMKEMYGEHRLSHGARYSVVQRYESGIRVIRTCHALDKHTLRPTLPGFGCE
ncbi:hypothetical protein AVEN_86323-1 [Araneus ventricosus]|uniref:Uncharacterized protein n=1 Tax=Araneus ventricosus TaxID=182803 RepID=A0A4Y2IHK4_ARAVE|nr:hypothetical protein AVEN_86323-1 [Araneus ventricosus]